MADLTSEQVAVIAEHERIDLMVAAEMGACLVHTEDGRARIARMVLDNIANAQRRGKAAHEAELKVVLQHFVREYGTLDGGPAEVA